MMIAETIQFSKTNTIIINSPFNSNKLNQVKYKHNNCSFRTNTKRITQTPTPRHTHTNAAICTPFQVTWIHPQLTFYVLNGVTFKYLYIPHTHTSFSVKIPLTNRSHMCIKYSSLHHHSLYATTLVSRYVDHLQKGILRVLCCAKELMISVSFLMRQPLTLLLFGWQVSFPPLVLTFDAD